MANNETKLYRLEGIPYQALYAKAQVKSKASSKKHQRLHFIFVLDNSGSMSGSPVRQINEALEHLHQQQLNDRGMQPIDIHIVTYNSTAKADIDPDISKFRIHATGCTNFAAAFATTRQLVTDLNSKRRLKPHDVIRICFMTDGEDNMSGDKLTPELSKLQLKLASLPVASTAVDVIAFTSTRCHDLLDRIRQIGTDEGAYTFASTTDGTQALFTMVSTMFDAAAGATMFEVPLAVTLGNGLTAIGSLPCNVLLQDDGMTAEVIVWCDNKQSMTKKFVEGVDDRDMFSSSISINDDEIVLNGNMKSTTLAERHDPHLYYKLYLKFVEKRLNEVCINPKAVTIEAVDGIQRTLQRISQTIFKCKELTSIERGEILLGRAELQEQCDQLYELLSVSAGAKAGRRDEVVSRVADLRFKGQLKARRARLLNRRMIDNSNDSPETALKQLNHKPEDLPTDEASSSFYSCIITCSTLAEVMDEAYDNVMGFGLAIQRPEAMVDSPTLVQITGMSTSLLSRNAFLDAIKYKLDVLDMDYEAIVGGYGISNRKPQACATVGISREPINAWLPLYICEAHWRRVKVLLKQSLGYFCCMDPLAYHEYQLDVPLVVLGTMACQLGGENISERFINVFLSFQKTCRMIVESEGRLDVHIHKRLHDFVQDPNMRLKHNLTSPTLIIGCMLVADAQHATEAMRNGIFKLLSHEVLRRAFGVVYKQKSPSAVQEAVLKLLSTGGCMMTDTEGYAELVAALVHDHSQGADNSHDDGVNAVEQLQQEAHQAALSMSLAPGLTKAQVKAVRTYGQSIQKAVPGPNIAKKSEAAVKEATEWWNDCLTRAKLKLKELLGGESDEKGQVDACETAIVHTESLYEMVRIFKTIARTKCMHPTPTMLLGAEATVACWLRSISEHPAFYKTLAPIDVVSSFMESHKATTAIPLTAVVAHSFGDTLNAVRGTFLQCIRLHKNSTARAAVAKVSSEFPQFVCPLAPTFATQCISVAKEVFSLQSQRAALEESLAISLRARMALDMLTKTTNMDSFIGLLNLATEQRDELYQELFNTLIADCSINSAFDKLRVMASGRWNDVVVFARGNIHVLSKDHWETVCQTYGDEGEANLRNEIFSHVSVLRYRESDLPNRHGSSNSHPHLHASCPACLAARQPLCFLGRHTR
jgi:uncharacterized protein YegL